MHKNERDMPFTGRTSAHQSPSTATSKSNDPGVNKHGGTSLFPSHQPLRAPPQPFRSQLVGKHSSWLAESGDASRECFPIRGARPTQQAWWSLLSRRTSKISAFRTLDSSFRPNLNFLSSKVKKFGRRMLMRAVISSRPNVPFSYAKCDTALGPGRVLPQRRRSSFHSRTRILRTVSEAAANASSNSSGGNPQILHEISETVVENSGFSSNLVGGSGGNHQPIGTVSQDGRAVFLHIPLLENLQGRNEGAISLLENVGGVTLLEDFQGRNVEQVGRKYEKISVGNTSEGNSGDFGKLVSAMGLIMGTAVGPGILGLPSATLPAGLQASTVMIVGAWAYVLASILLVAELSCAVMADRGEDEISFTGLVEHTLGFSGARAVAVVYASLNYALLVACVAGLGSILHGWLPMSPGAGSALSAAVVGGLVAFAPFKILDGFNRGLCGLMMTAIVSLVAVGMYAGKDILINRGVTQLSSFTSILSAVPITVLTLGFHVITPVVCRLMKGSPQEARRAIVLGGSVPLAMVLAWNGVILSLSPVGSSALDPIKLLLSLNQSAAPAVQGFAFAALGSTLIGYAVSFPKQLADTSRIFSRKKQEEGERIFADSQQLGPLLWALCPPTIAAIMWPTAFASALDFAGVYANCFLFGILPPVMTWIYRYRQNRGVTVPSTRDKQLVPGGKLLLIVLLSISILLGVKPKF